MTQRKLGVLDDIAVFAANACADESGNGIQLHNAQYQGLACQQPDITIVAGRQWGKSTGEAVRALYTAFKYPNTARFIVAPTQDQAGIIFSHIQTMVHNGPLQAYLIEERQSPFPKLKFRNGSTIHARSCGHDGKYLRGNKSDFVTLDECAFQPYRVVEEVVPKMMATSKFGWTVRISTPYGRNHFYESYLRGIIKFGKGYASFCFPSWTSPHINREFLAREREVTSQMTWDVEYGARFNESQNAMYPWSDIEAVIDDDLLVTRQSPSMQPIAGNRYVIGWDPAMSHDRSALCVIDCTQDPWKVVALEDLSGRRYSVQEQMVAAYAERYYNATVCMDATSKFQDRTLESLSDLGVEVYPYVFTQTSKWELHQACALDLQKRRVKLPRHTDFLQEARLFECIENPNTHVIKLGAPEGRNNYDDYVTAWALAMAQARVRPAEIDVSFMQMGA